MSVACMAQAATKFNVGMLWLGSCHHSKGIQQGRQKEMTMVDTPYVSKFLVN